jgi:hypothetical protein
MGFYRPSDIDTGKQGKNIGLQNTGKDAEKHHGYRDDKGRYDKQYRDDNFFT